jgi:hypothetical protein
MLKTVPSLLLDFLAVVIMEKFDPVYYLSLLNDFNYFLWQTRQM